MRSISPIIAIIVLTLMTVAAAGMAYMTITGYQSSHRWEHAGELKPWVLEPKHS